MNNQLDWNLKYTYSIQNFQNVTARYVQLGHLLNTENLCMQYAIVHIADYDK
jgi:hypothetical protein